MAQVKRRAVVVGASATGLGVVAAMVGIGVSQAQPEHPAAKAVPSTGSGGSEAVVAASPFAGGVPDARTPTPTPTVRVERAPVLDVRRYGADPTGTRDSAPAVRRALAALGARGGTVAFAAGTFRIIATAAAPFLSLPAQAVVRGEGTTRTTILFESDDPAGYREFARPTGADVVLQDFTLRRSGTFPSVVLNLPAVSGFNISRVVLDGGYRAGDPNYCHGLQLAAQPGTSSGVRIEDSVFTRCTSCTLITNDSAGTVRGLLIRRCRMQNIDVNAPEADVSGVRITDCVVDASDSEYFGIAFAHVRDAVVSRTMIRGAQKEAIHVEDACSGITISRCRIERSALGATDAYAYVQVINASRDITIERCVIDARGATAKTGPSLIAVQQGGQGTTAAGRAFAPPQDVTIEKNRLLTDGGSVRTGVYLERISGATVIGNHLDGGGGVTQGVFSGGSGSAVILVQPTSATVSDNSITGWRTALAGQGTGAGRVRFLRNRVTDCRRVLDATGVEATGTIVQRVVDR